MVHAMHQRAPLTWLFWLAALCAASACQDREQAQAPTDDSSRARRLFRPPPDQVRPAPPHAIHEDGVGPYQLGMPLGDILDLLPHGPRVVLTQIDGVAYYNLVRADDDAIVMGITRALGVVFVSVLDERIARTEDGVGVGSELARVREVMGPAMAHPSMAMDPRMVGFLRLPGARFVLDKTEGDARRVIAVSIRRMDAALADRLMAPAAEHPDTNPAQVATAPADDQDPNQNGRAPLGMPEYQRSGQIFSAPLDIDGDGAPELAVVYQETQTLDRDSERVISLEILRQESGRMQSLFDEPIYRISSRSAAWVGTSLDELEFLVELWADGKERVHVTGLYLQWDGGRLVNAVQLMATDVVVRRRRQRPDHEGSSHDGGGPAPPMDGGVGDANPDASKSIPARPHGENKVKGPGKGPGKAADGPRPGAK